MLSQIFGNFLKIKTVKSKYTTFKNVHCIQLTIKT